MKRVDERILTLEEKEVKLMEKLAEDIEQIEKKIKHVNIINFKNRAICNLKIGARIIEFITPYILISGLTLSAHNIVFKDIPIERDVVPVYEHTQMNFDNLNNIQYVRQYGKFEDETNNLYYRSKWKEVEDGFYERVVQTYEIPYKNYEEILPLLTKEPITMESLLGNPKTSKRETRNNITEGEIQEPAYINVTLYSEDGSKYIMGQQSITDNIIYTVIYILMTGFIECGLADKTHSFGMDLSKWIVDLDNRYQPMNIAMLEKELEIKKKNYLRLGGTINDEHTR